MTVVIGSNSNAEIPDSVNSEVMQSVTQENIPVLGNAPSMGCGNTFSSASQAFSSAAHENPNQPLNGLTAQAVTSLAVERLYSQETASTESQVCNTIENQIYPQ